MSKPRRQPTALYPDEAACNRKVRYTTELAARMGAQAVLTNPCLRPPSVMYVYCCPICKGWHCTRKPGDKGPAVTKRELFATPGSEG